MTQPHNDVAIITGAGRGLGAQIATSLAEAGFRIAVTDASKEGLESFSANTSVPSDRFTTVLLDVREKEHFEQALAAVRNHWGSVEVLVNCAAVTRTTPLFEITPDEFSEVMDINLRSVFVGSQVFGSYFKEQGYGRIVNIASLAGQNGGTATGGHYAASKGGIITLSKVFARELAPHGVTVNAIAPGPLDVPLLKEILPSEKLSAMPSIIPVGKLGDPTFIGDIVALLASRRASSITGATVDANGGLNLR